MTYTQYLQRRSSYPKIVACSLDGDPADVMLNIGKHYGWIGSGVPVKEAQEDLRFCFLEVCRTKEYLWYMAHNPKARMSIQEAMEALQKLGE